MDWIGVPANKPSHFSLVACSCERTTVGRGKNRKCIVHGLQEAEEHIRNPCPWAKKIYMQRKLVCGGNLMFWGQPCSSWAAVPGKADTDGDVATGTLRWSCLSESEEEGRIVEVVFAGFLTSAFRFVSEQSPGFIQR